MNQEAIKSVESPAQKRKMNGCLIATIIVVIVAILAVGGCFLLGGAALVGSANKQAEQEAAKLQSLESATPSDLQPAGELANIFNLMSDFTDLQRKNKEVEITGKIVEWTLPLYELRETNGNYRIQTSTGANVGTSVTIIPRGQADLAFLTQLKTGDSIRFKGFITGTSMRSLEISPAILTDPSIERNEHGGINETDSTVQPPERTTAKETQNSASPVDLNPRELGAIFNLMSDFTEIQRDSKEAEIKGSVVEWSLPVYEIKKSGNGYLVMTESDDNVGADVNIVPKNANEKEIIEKLKTGDYFQFRGIIDGVSLLRRIKIKSANLVHRDSALSSVKDLTATKTDADRVRAQVERELNQSAQEALDALKAVGLAGDNVSITPTVPGAFTSISAEALQTATPSDLSPHEIRSFDDWNSDAGKIIEWSLNIKDIQRIPNMPNSYLLETGRKWEIPCRVEMISLDDAQAKVIENLSPNTSVTIRGQLTGIVDSRLVIKPAIFTGKTLSSVLAEKIATLDKNSQENLILSDLESDIKPNANLTTIQRENLVNGFRTLRGRIVQGVFAKYSAEPTSDGCVLIQYDGQPYTQRDNPVTIQIFIPFRDEQDRDRIISIISKAKPFPFRGYINKIEAGRILIAPAILVTTETLSATADTLAAQDWRGDGEFFATSITKNDTRNSNGVRITDPVLILMQDRANVHKFGNPDADHVDEFFKLPENRAKIRTYLARGSFTQAVQNSILNANGERFNVRIFKNEKGQACVDVTFEKNSSQRSEVESEIPGQRKVLSAASVDLYELIDSESNIREGPGTNYPIVRQSRKGEVGEHQSAKMGWMKLQFSDGSMGWVHEKSIKSKN